MRLKAGAVAVVLAAGTTLMFVGPASAQQGGGPNEPLDVSPTSGPPGTVITVRGEECISPGEETVVVDLFNETTQQSVADASLRVGQVGLPEGAWSAELVVPEGVDPDDAFVVVASCRRVGPEGDPVLLFRYERVPFDVPGGAPTTTPPAPPVLAPAAPAEPVVAEPAFTG